MLKFKQNTSKHILRCNLNFIMLDKINQLLSKKYPLKLLSKPNTIAVNTYKTEERKSTSFQIYNFKFDYFIVTSEIFIEVLNFQKNFTYQLMYLQFHQPLAPKDINTQSSSLRKTPKNAFRSNSHTSDPPLFKEHKSQLNINESKKSVIINFKQGFSKKRVLSGRYADSNTQKQKQDRLESPLMFQKKSKFVSELQLKSNKSKCKKNVEESQEGSCNEVLKQNLSAPNFKKKVTFKTKASFNKNDSESFIPPRLTFNQVSSKSSLRSSRQQAKRQVRLSHFHKGKFLGKGTSAEVYLVQHKMTGWTMAMKIIKKEPYSSNQKLINQMVEEIKIHSFVDHPNICSMYGFFSDQTNIYILLQLCTNKHLYSIMKNHKGIKQSAANQYISQVADSLDYLHSNDIIHRDIKPENILLSHNVLKLADFGWAAHCTNGLRNTICGTPIYLSPQLIRGEEYRMQTDIWALGILSYELICGKTPFKIMDHHHLDRIVNDEIKFPDQIQMSTDFRDFIAKCLQKNHQDRASIVELKNHRFLKGKCTQQPQFQKRINLL